MAWQPIIDDSQTLQAGQRVRVSLDFRGWLVGDIDDAISASSSLQVTGVERSILGFIDSVEGVVKSNTTVGSLRSGVQGAIDTWSTFDVKVVGVDSYALSIGDLAPSTQTAITAASVAVILAVIVVAVVIYRKELGL